MKCRNCKNLGWLEEAPGKSFFGWCSKVLDSPDPDIERECRGFERRTNADRIRAMSDEGLQAFLWEVYRAGEADGYHSSFVPKGFIWDLGWLQSPAEGNG